MALERPKITELINVHKVTGEKEAILFLKNAEKEFVEGVFYQAKHFGKGQFICKDVLYDVIRNKDYSFSILENPDQNLSSESLA